jgi:hypothetical protein
MKAPRPRFRNRDAEGRRAALAAAARKKRLLVLPPAASGVRTDQAPAPAAAPPAEISDETSFSSVIQPGFALLQRADVTAASSAMARSV